MATCLDYAKIACAVYYTKKSQYYDEGNMVDNWVLQKWETGTFFGDGFQGGIYQNDKEVVVGFCGTNPKQKGKFLADLSADIRIGVKILPNQSSSARKMVKAAKSIAKGRKVSVCGHSLGGGLSQVAGVWEKVHFCSFNAPPMKASLYLANINIFKPMMMIRSLKSQKIKNTEGVNFQIKGDIISSEWVDGHIGTFVQFDKPSTQFDGAHAKNNCWQAIMETDWAFIDPFEGSNY